MRGGAGGALSSRARRRCATCRPRCSPRKRRSHAEAAARDARAAQAAAASAAEARDAAARDAAATAARELSQARAECDASRDRLEATQEAVRCLEALVQSAASDHDDVAAQLRDAAQGQARLEAALHRGEAVARARGGGGEGGVRAVRGAARRGERARGAAGRRAREAAEAARTLAEARAGEADAEARGGAPGGERGAQGEDGAVSGRPRGARRVAHGGVAKRAARRRRRDGREKHAMGVELEAQRRARRQARLQRYEEMEKATALEVKLAEARARPPRAGSPRQESSSPRTHATKRADVQAGRV